MGDYPLSQNPNKRKITKLFVPSLKTKTEDFRQKQMQESRDNGYVVCETESLGYKGEDEK